MSELRIDYDRVLRVLRRNDSDVRLCVRCGSHVYGTAREGSDEDFLVVLNDAEARQDLLWGENLNVVVHGAGTYAKALEDQSIFALEGLFAPAEHRLKDARPPFVYRRDVARLRDSAKARSDSDWTKAQKRFDAESSPKRVLHALRVLAFATQIAEHGAIVDFRVAGPWWARVRSGEHATWEALAKEFAPVRDGLLVELRR
ncbi:nucleotidyltransferase domain-containing protein [Pendulispora brunnea]|uniref:Nucleotidyltransferase domain-containing protein n=1 Tax=Pendulispora brunnea TaxID=2905690 RepID=A0ABZ2KLN0_9BACT